MTNNIIEQIKIEYVNVFDNFGTREIEYTDIPSEVSKKIIESFRAASPGRFQELLQEMEECLKERISEGYTKEEVAFSIAVRLNYGWDTDSIEVYSWGVHLYGISDRTLVLPDVFIVPRIGLMKVTNELVIETISKLKEVEREI
jgi:hypothetical protein